MIITWQGGIAVPEQYTAIIDETGMIKAVKVREGKVYKVPEKTLKLKEGQDDE